MRILALCGSLRAQSSNRSLLEGAAALVPERTVMEIYEGLAGLPHFNPDIEDDNAPSSVAAFRAALNAADGIVISTPEYAHGVPGALKNALDWVVGTSELVDKPVALFNASPRSTFAVASLSETLTVMSARLINEAHVTVQMAGRAARGRRCGRQGACARPSGRPSAFCNSHRRRTDRYLIFWQQDRPGQPAGSFARMTGWIKQQLNTFLLPEIRKACAISWRRPACRRRGSRVRRRPAHHAPDARRQRRGPRGGR